MAVIFIGQFVSKKEQQVINCGFSAKSVPKFSTEIDVFIDTPKTLFLIFF